MAPIRTMLLIRRGTLQAGSNPDPDPANLELVSLILSGFDPWPIPLAHNITFSGLQGNKNRVAWGIMKSLRAILTPAELPALRQSDLADRLCVVFDVLRATSTFITALHHGANRIIPVSDIAEALAWREKAPQALLAGERHGVRISADLTGGIEFDLGNSPREFTPEVVCGRTIVSTTTNGTLALNACAGAAVVLAGSFLNLTATADFIRHHPAEEVILVCAGTGSSAALEDVLAAGALAHRLASPSAGFKLADSAAIAWRTFLSGEASVAEALSTTDNGRRLLGIPDLRADVAFCGQFDCYPLVARQTAAGLQRFAPT